MKQWNLTLALICLVLFSSCSKDKITEDDTMVASLSAGMSLVTGWENGYSWEMSDSADYHVFSHERMMPELTSSILEKGAVLVALKNLPYKEDSLYTKPKLVPFSLIPYYGHDQQGKDIYDQHWYIIPSVGKIVIKYRTNRHNFSELPVIPPDGRLEARYFLFTDADLKRLGHTQKSIQQITYEDLIKLPGIPG
jgi:hypothetical protein